MVNYAGKNDSACLCLSGIFRRRCPKKSSVYSLPTTKITQEMNSKNSPKTAKFSAVETETKLVVHNPAADQPKPPSSQRNHQARRLSDAEPPSSRRNHQARRLSDAAARSSTSSSSPLSSQAKTIHPKSPALGHMGNLRMAGNGSLSAGNTPKASSKDTITFLSKIRGSGNMGNIFGQFHGLPSKIDPDALKSMGNEAYNMGRFEEALNLYDRAIALDPDNAVYHCNKSAALTSLDRLAEAVDECRLAIRIHPSHCRAHHRLATLYLSLGETEQALYHFGESGNCSEDKDINKTHALQKCLFRCSEARLSQSWKILLKETQLAISLGAKSSHKVYALQSEALLRLRRHKEAYAACERGRNLRNEFAEVIDMADRAYPLMIEAQIYSTMGRFEEALLAAQQAAEIDPTNVETSAVAKRVRAISSARLSGNLLFRASRFSEACVAYSEGLELDPYNSVLLCNRGTCRSKLGQFEKAVEDCSVALSVQPSYSKARLRRANCNAKLERWEASIQDYEVLISEMPVNEEVGRGLFEVKLQLKKQRGEDVKDMKFGSNLVSISSNDRFRHFITSPGMTVVLFCQKRTHKKELQVIEKVCRRFPSVNFLQVEIEEHPFLAKSEAVSSIPAFKIYKNGSSVREFSAADPESLESAVRLFSS